MEGVGKVEITSFKRADLQAEAYLLTPRTQSWRSNHSTATFGTKLIRNGGSLVLGKTLLSAQTENALFL
jgi:hypothetical protein